MRFYSIFAIALLFTACSVPVLDSPACLESRQILKKTYSVYIDSFEEDTKDKIKLIEDRLSDDIKKQALSFEGDFLTRAKKAVGARAGKCVEEAGVTTFEVKVFIKVDKEKPSERNLFVGMKKIGEDWKIASVEPRD